MVQIKMAARPRFELGKCQSQSLVPYRLAIGQYGGADETRTRVQKQYHIRNLILTLQALP